MTDRWMDRLSEYLDGDLDAADTAALESHLAVCPECRAAIEDLRAVVARASGLDDRDPPTDLWPGIAAQLSQGSRVSKVTPIGGWRRAAGRRVSLSIPQLAAAGIALLAFSASALWVALGRDGFGPAVPSVTAVSAPDVAAVSPATVYGAAIADLERVLRESRASLDTATIRVIDESLRTIDQAIAEAEAALAEDPASRYLNNHLNSTMQRKLELLNQAAMLAPASS
jgi:anti-sigma factor RsiW